MKKILLLAGIVSALSVGHGALADDPAALANEQAAFVSGLSGQTALTSGTVNQLALQAITAQNTKFSQGVANQDLNAIGSIYANNVIFLAPDVPTIRGRAGVVAYINQQLQAGATASRLTTEEIRPLLSPSGVPSLQYEEIGINIVTFNVGGQLVDIPAKYIVIWDFGRSVRNVPVVLRDSFSFSIPLP
jgi:hypothetical protein